MSDQGGEQIYEAHKEKGIQDFWKLHLDRSPPNIWVHEII